MTGRLLSLLAVVVVALAASSSALARGEAVRLKVGDAIAVEGTSIACFAIVSNQKAGVGCVLLDGSDPKVGTYGVGIAVDGTVVVNRVKPDGGSQRILKRTPQSVSRSTKVYTGRPGDEFVLRIDAGHFIACRVVLVRPGEAKALYQGRKIGCWRTVGADPAPKTDGVQISERFVSVFRFDAKGVVGSMPLIKAQPAA